VRSELHDAMHQLRHLLNSACARTCPAS
jgi:hypothetical protein